MTIFLLESVIGKHRLQYGGHIVQASLQEMFLLSVSASGECNHHYHSPVCDTTKEEFTNLCLLKAHGRQLAYYGHCQVWHSFYNSFLCGNRQKIQQSVILGKFSIIWAIDRLEMSIKQIINYHKISDIRCTKSQNVNASRLGLQLSLCNILKPGVKMIMKM